MLFKSVLSACLVILLAGCQGISINAPISTVAEANASTVEEYYAADNVPTTEETNLVRLARKLKWPAPAVDCKWVFDKPYEVFEFANGDYGIVGPATIVSVYPAPASGHNGSVLNPAPSDYQSYDVSARNYTASHAVSFPVTLQPGDVLVSTTWAAGATNTAINYAGVLTCVSKVPDGAVFRPGYCDSGGVMYSAMALDVSSLPKYPVPASAPSFETVKANLSGLWLDHQGTWAGKYIHPASAMPSYGREIATQVNEGALMLLLDIPDNEKLWIAKQLIQLGLDNASIVANGGGWWADGGHMSGRKLPVLLAGYFLNAPEITAYATDYHSNYGEDCQTFYVSQADVTRHPEYAGMIGTPEWGIRHCYWPDQDTPDWGSGGYRTCCTATTWSGAVIVCQELGLVNEWNHQAFFDYLDRYVTVTTEYQFWTQFMADMYNTYRVSN